MSRFNPGYPPKKEEFTRLKDTDARYQVLMIYWTAVAKQKGTFEFLETIGDLVGSLYEIAERDPKVLMRVIYRELISKYPDRESFIEQLTPDEIFLALNMQVKRI